MRLVSALAALLALSAAPAAAAPVCIPQADADTAALVVAPGAVRALRRACLSFLPRDAYLSRNGEVLAGRYQNAVVRAGARADAVVAKLIGMPGMPIAAAAVAGLAEALVAPAIAKIDGESCTMINRALGLIDPLPVTNAAGLFVLIAEYGLKNQAKGKQPLLPFVVCPSKG